MEKDFCPELYPNDPSDVVRNILLEREMSSPGVYPNEKANVFSATPNPILSVFIIPIVLLNGT